MSVLMIGWFEEVENESLYELRTFLRTDISAHKGLFAFFLHPVCFCFGVGKRDVNA